MRTPTALPFLNTARPAVRPWSALLLAALLASGTGCSKDKAAPRGRDSGRGDPVPVRLAQVQTRTIRLNLDYSADILARDEAVVFSRTPGKVIEKLLQDGDPVRKGQAIAMIDRDEVGLTFERAPVESPISGQVGRVYVDRGANVTPQTPVALVVNMDSVRIRLDLPEKYLPMMSTQLPAGIVVDAWPGQVFTGRVSSISPVVDIATRTAPVEIRIENADHRLKPGMFARVNVTLREQADALTVPREAVIGRGNDTSLFVLEGDVARLRRVTTGIRDGADWEITSGLRPGESVVVMGQQRLKDGARTLQESAGPKPVAGPDAQKGKPKP